jgi:hypothetical protein
MLYSTYLKKLEKKVSSKNVSATKKQTNEDTYKTIRSNVETEFAETNVREVTTIRKLGIINYRFRIVRVTKYEFVLYKNEDIVSDANSLSKTLTIMFEAMNLT